MKRIVVGVLAAAGLLAGCGPIESVAVIDDAQVALTGAKAANGDRYAPYEYTSAELYLDKAREERGHAEYQQAIGYARQAREMAREAESKSMKATQQQRGRRLPGRPGALPERERTTSPPPPPPPPTTSEPGQRIPDRAGQDRGPHALTPRSLARPWPPPVPSPSPPSPACFLFAGCVTGGQLRATAGVVQENLKLARKQGAMKCAPRQLARGRGAPHLRPRGARPGRLAAGPAGARPRPDLHPQGRAPLPGLHQAGADQEAQAASGDRQDQGEGHRRRRDPRQHGQVPQASPGPSRTQGCPVVKPKDTDGDGLTDDVDRCPKVPGPASNQGCPAAEAPLDTDGDGIPRHRRQVPQEGRAGVEPRVPHPRQRRRRHPRQRRQVPQRARGQGRVPGPGRLPGSRERRGRHPRRQGQVPSTSWARRRPTAARPRTATATASPTTRTSARRRRASRSSRAARASTSWSRSPRKKIEIKQQVHFASGRYRILTDSFELLNEVAQVLKDNPKITLRIEGHTDSRGSDSFNLRLSQKRASSVRRYLIRPEPSTRACLGPWASARRVPSPPTPRRAGREANRRVEFVITSQ